MPIIKDGMPHLTGDLAIDALDLEPVAAMVVGEPALQSAEGELAVAAVPAEGRDAVHRRSRPDLRLGRGRHLRRVEDAQMHADARQATASGWPTLSGKLDGGEVTGLFEARNNDGTALVSTQFKLAAPISARCSTAAA